MTGVVDTQESPAKGAFQHSVNLKSRQGQAGNHPGQDQNGHRRRQDSQRKQAENKRYAPDYRQHYNDDQDTVAQHHSQVSPQVGAGTGPLAGQNIISDSIGQPS